MAFGDIRGTKTGTATSITASMPCATGTNFTVAVGDIIVGLLAEQASKTVTACTDNLTNTYTALGVGADAGTVTGRGFYTRVTNAGTISSLTFTATASSNNCVTLAVGFEGPFEVSPLDANPTTIINDNTTPYTCPPTGTLAQPDEKIVCAIVHNGAPTLTATSPNLKAIELATASILKAALGHQTVSSTASVTPAWTSSATPTASGYATVSFKKALTINSGDGDSDGIGTASGVGESLISTADAWNAYDKSANITLSNSDKTAILSSSITAGVRSTQRRTNGAVGKYYVEFVINASNPFGVRVGLSSVSQSVTVTTDAISVDASDGTTYLGATSGVKAWDGNSVDGDVICLAWDTSAETFWARLNNGDWNNDPEANPATGYLGKNVSAAPNAVDYALWVRAANSGRGATLRTETAEFSYAGPSGFTSWMGEALGAATTDGVGDADGVGAAAATSEATKETTGTATGVATASGVSPVATTDAVGAASGIGAATAVGEAFTGIPDAWSAADKSANITLSNNDKTATLTAAVTSGVRSTTKYLNGTEANKFYVEFVLTNAISGFSCQVGIREASAAVNTSAGSTFQCASNSGNIVIGSSTTVGNIGGAPLLDGDVICMAWSPSTERGWFRKNGGLWNNDAAANPATNTNGFDISALNNTSHGLLFLAASSLNGAIVTVRTELADLTLTAPSGFVSWMGEALGAATSDAVGDADGVGTASATGAQTAGAPGAASGIGTAAADGRQVVTGIAASAGTGAATAQGAQTAGVTGTAAGVGTASSVGQLIVPATGTAGGIGAASAVGDVGSAAVSATGTAAGAGTASAQGAQTAEAQGTAAGTGTAAGFSSGAAIASGAGAASGTGLAAATGYSIIPATANAAGVGAATAAGAQTAGVGGSAVGVGTAGAQGAQTALVSGAATGIGGATALSSGAAIASATGTAAGVGATTAGGAKLATAVASATGLGGAAATGFSHSAAAVGTAIGIGSATGLSSGAALAPAVGSASGVGSAAATGRQFATVVGAVSGIGAAAATGNKIATASGSAAGVGAAAATGFATSAAAVGAAAGLGTVAAVGRTIAATTGAVAGAGTATATSGAIKTAAGAASGIGSATATGFQAAVVFNEAAGVANGIGTTSGIGFAIQPSATPGDRVTGLPFVARGASVPASMRGASVAGSRRIAAVAGHSRIAIVPRRDRAA